MKKPVIALLSLMSFYFSNAQSIAEKDINKVLSNQVVSWNAGDLDVFMEGYWNNDSLMFVGKKGVTYGYQNVLNNYRKGYPDTAAMGQLSYDIIHIKELSPAYYFIVGKYHLARSIGDAQGHFTLLFRKINGKWLIICDQSS